MKISKERLMQIIKEEVENSQQSSREDVSALGEFSKKFLELSRQIKSVKGLDPKEMSLMLNILTDLIRMAASGSSASILKQLDVIVDKKTGSK
jgi:hypothetical protein